MKCVIEYLKKEKKVSSIGLWGKSMGAVTAILFIAENPDVVDYAVLDSGFTSLKMVFG